MLKQKMDDEHDSTRLNHALAPFSARKKGREDRGHTRLGVAPFLAVPILQQLVVGMRRESALLAFPFPPVSYYQAEYCNKGDSDASCQHLVRGVFCCGQFETCGLTVTHRAVALWTRTCCNVQTRLT
jgi:hypothetical protein